MNYALFMDLDNTLITTISGRKFPENYNDWKFLPGIITALQNFFKENEDFGYLLIVTNQGGIEKGFVDEESFNIKVNEILNELAQYLHSIRIELSYSDKMECEFRKPSPKTAFFFRKLHKLDLSKCIMVGDADGSPMSFSDSDKKFAENAGIGEFYSPEEFIFNNNGV